MVERLGRQAVELGQPLRGVARVREDRPALAEHLGVELDQAVPEPHVRLDVAEVAVFGSAQLVRRSILMDQPRDFPRMANEVRRKLRGDHQIDRLAVALAEIEESPRRGVRKDLVLRVPLEGNADQLCLMPALAQLTNELPHVHLGAAVDERHLGLTDHDAEGGHGTGSRVLRF